MAIDLHAINENVPLPPGLTIHPVNDLSDLQEWVGVWLFPAGLERVRESYVAALGGLGFAPDRPLRHYIGRIDGHPVATVALFYSAGVAAVHYVVTHADWRRQGIGAAMTLMALQEARAQGWRIAVLTASSLGYHIYYRLGFRPYCRMRIFSWEPVF
jgi:GNAT superfamily N-acetyltransferase